MGWREFRAESFESLLRGRGGMTFEIEEGSCGSSQGAGGAGDNENQLFGAQASRNVGGPQSENEIEELLAELAHFIFARDGNGSERVAAMKNDAAAKNVRELGGEGVGGRDNFVLEKKHRM